MTSSIGNPSYHAIMEAIALAIIKIKIQYILFKILFSEVRHRLSRTKLGNFIVNMSEDQLYEDRLKSGGVIL